MKITKLQLQQIIKEELKNYKDRRLNEGHGLSKKDLNYLKKVAKDKNIKDSELKRILRFIIKSNIIQTKTQDLSKKK
jgi:hypothetical protein